jgi:ABC-2 type transport system ATP-binding protein
VADASASAEAVRRLDARRMPIIAVELEQPSLDDVFLTLTRHSAGDQPTEHPRVQEAV